MTKTHERCGACAVARVDGDLDEAVQCRTCRGTGIVRKRESWVCNGCGGCLCPEGESAPFGLVDAKVSGGYSSTHLSDCTNYKFSLCEACLRKLWAGCAVKPAISEYHIGVIGGDDVATDEAYDEEAASRVQQDAEAAARKDRFFALFEERKCADSRSEEGREYCEREGAGQLLYEDASWTYAKRWLCSHHLRNAFTVKGATVLIAGREPLTWAARSRMGLDLIALFRAGRSPEIAEDDEAKAAIAISSLLPLLIAKDTRDHAASELHRIAGAVPHANKWVGHRIPLGFRPDEGEHARLVNDWLTWGKSQGYGEAAAAACLRYAPEVLWDDKADREEVKEFE